MTKPLRKAVIPAAGFGTRMLPAAKAVPKELLPILDRPTIQYVIEEAAVGGVDDVLLVTSRDKRAIEDHFDRNVELESRLKSSGKESLLESITEILTKVKIHSVRQPEQRGLGDAVAQARRHVGDEPFVCLLGDTIFSGDPQPTQQLAAA
jgi:UTP--glucose-1-phosphate uridylyltransferase